MPTITRALQLRNPHAIFALGCFSPSGRSSCKSKDFIEAFDYAVDLLSGGGTSEAETDGAFANLRRHAHRLELRRKLHASGMTRRARRGCYPFQPRQYLAADLADEGDIERVRQTMYRMAVEEHAFSKSPRLCRRIGSFARRLSAAEALNYFRHAGYA
jgi:hypothetical protein